MATIKQQKAFDYLAENNGSVSEAMRAAGYSHKTNNPSMLTESKGYKELLAEHNITDDRMAVVLDRGLDAKKTITSPTEPDKEVDDYSTQHKYLETGLRLLGHSKESPNLTFNQLIMQQKEHYGRISGIHRDLSNNN